MPLGSLKIGRKAPAESRRARMSVSGGWAARSGSSGLCVALLCVLGAVWLQSRVTHCLQTEGPEVGTKWAPKWGPQSAGRRVQRSEATRERPMLQSGQRRHSAVVRSASSQQSAVNASSTSQLLSNCGPEPSLAQVVEGPPRQTNAPGGPAQGGSSGSAQSTVGGAEEFPVNNVDQWTGFTQDRPSQFVKPNFYTLRLKLDPQKRKFSGLLMIALDVQQDSSSSSSEQGNHSKWSNYDKHDSANNNNNNNNQEEEGAQEDKSRADEVLAEATSSSGPESRRYLTLHAGANLNIRKAFYVLGSRGGNQIRASRIGRNLTSELLTLDFHPHTIASGQGLLLLVYSGSVNETHSHGLFLHRSQKGGRARPSATSAAAANPNAQGGVAGVGVAQGAAANGASAGGTSAGAHAHAHADQFAGLATHMEPSFARRLFPAWDEPHLKARFSLIVVLPFRNYQSLSNMPVKRKSISLSCSGESLQEVEFHTTPTMSTYLLALVVGRFEHLERVTSNNCRVRAYFYANQTQVGALESTGSGAGSGSAGALEQNLGPNVGGNASSVALAQPNHRREAARMALELAVRTFDHLESLLGVKYPLNKFDMVALRDFNHGGMENWGAAIFHENYLLCDEGSQNMSLRVNGASSRPKRLVVPLVVAHEIVHQWFGNLITSRRWSYLWLNEGFAQLLMYKVADELLPSANYWLIFLEDNRRSAMNEDELLVSSRPLEPNLELSLGHPDHHLSLFDQLTYNKGALVLRMVQFALGEQQFFAGLRHYLLKHSYESVTSHDLWQALEESNRRQERQLESLMQAWLKRDGFPLLSVCACELADHFLLELRQERFTLLSPSERPRNSQATGRPQTLSNASWPLHVTLAAELRPRPEAAELRLWRSAAPEPEQRQWAFLLNEPQTLLRLPKSHLGNWFKLNHNATGYFRVDYLAPECAGSGSGSGSGASIGTGSVPIGAGSGSSEAISGAQPVDMLARLEGALRSGQLAPVDRFNLLDDLFALVLAGRKSVDQFLRFVWRSLEAERELLVLRSLADSLERIRLVLVSNEPGPLLQWAQSTQQSATQTSANNSSWGWPAELSSGTGSAAGSGASSKVARNFDLFVQRLAKRLGQAGGAHLLRGAWPQPHAADESPRVASALMPAESAPHRWPPAPAGSWNSLNANSEPSWESQSSSGLEGSLSGHAPPQSTNGELAELLAGLRAAHNDQELARHARRLLAQRLATSASGGDAFHATSAAPELAGRELRASVYALALRNAEQAPPTSVRARRAPDASHAHSAQHSLWADEWARPPGDGVGVAGGPEVHAHMLQLYAELAAAAANGQLSGAGSAALVESSAERTAIVWALGSTRNSSLQLQLLNLALSSGHFRQQDAMVLVESLARSLSGRQLIWLLLQERHKQFETRQLLATAVKSISRGLLDWASVLPSATGQPASKQLLSRLNVELQMRKLHQEYASSGDELGKVLAQAAEWLRINTNWYKRDRRKLESVLEELLSSPS